jgi:hypothetical protein
VIMVDFFYIHMRECRAVVGVGGEATLKRSSLPVATQITTTLCCAILGLDVYAGRSRRTLGVLDEYWAF